MLKFLTHHHALVIHQMSCDNHTHHHEILLVKYTGIVENRLDAVGISHHVRKGSIGTDRLHKYSLPHRIHRHSQETRRIPTMDQCSVVQFLSIRICICN